MDAILHWERTEERERESKWLYSRSMDAARVGVEQAWLAAGKRGDVGEMRRLRAQHPEWLDLARVRPVKQALTAAESRRRANTHPPLSRAMMRLQVVAVPKGLQAADSASPRSPTTFCDWEQFYLATIGDSALHAAAWEGHAPILQYLLEEGQSPDARDDRGMTVLVVTLLRHSVQAMRAVFLGPDIVQLNTVVDVSSSFVKPVSTKANGRCDHCSAESKTLSAWRTR